MSYSKADEAKKAGDYEEAASEYAKYALSKLVDNNFAVDGRMRWAVGELLQAMSCDAHVGNTARAQHLFKYARWHLEEVRENTQKGVLVGLTHEWEGDGLLYLGDSEAVQKYQTAQGYYQDLTWHEERWKDEPDFMEFYFAYEEFVKMYGVMDSTELCQTSFPKRIEYKIEFARKHIE
ncbi:hypothetical protein SAMN04487950_0108 [Halogranum rubrum]|uniref:Uncharacterized protein n=1 Tax=Halogranum rubrum TaxID=553466 RepID=A0A1I4AUG9_9EURY|nr:hypothetical protein [Halogranum rubrum]SFK59943.1 hypothetical protein SAMN04487950_0108 [Halogranum rubrum]